MPDCGSHKTRKTQKCNLLNNNMQKSPISWVEIKSTIKQNMIVRECYIDLINLQCVKNYDLYYILFKDYNEMNGVIWKFIKFLGLLVNVLLTADVGKCFTCPSPPRSYKLSQQYQPRLRSSLSTAVIYSITSVDLRQWKGQKWWVVSCGDSCPPGLCVANDTLLRDLPWAGSIWPKLHNRLSAF